MSLFELFPMLIGGFVGMMAALGALWVMSGNAVREYPQTVLSLPPQNDVDAKIAAWAAQNGYRLQADQGDGEVHYHKGKGWLTSSTALIWQPITERLLIREEVNFLVTRRAFAIDAPILLGKPVRARKIKAINTLLQQLSVPPLQIKRKGR
ncbi:MAG: hypothetical protein Q4G42_02345 [Neisseria sp.]|nr:hypothetical protein [Neisseria sp.]